MNLSYNGAKRLEAVLHNWLVFAVLAFLGSMFWDQWVPVYNLPGWTWSSSLLNMFLSASGVVWYIIVTQLIILAVTPHHVHKVVDCSEAIKILDTITEETQKTRS